MKKLFEKENLIKLLMFLVIIEPLLDIYLLFDEKVVSVIGFSPSTVIRYFFLALVFLLFIFVIKMKKQLYYYISYGVLVLVYLCFHNYFCNNFTTLFPGNFNYTIMSSISYIIRLLIPLSLVVIVSNIKIDNRRFNMVIDYVILLITGIIVFGNLFKVSIGAYITIPINYTIIDWFKNIHELTNYLYTSTRGWFNFANNISTILFGLTALSVYRLYSKFNLKNIIILLLLMLSMFMLGTKVATFGFIISSIIITLVFLFFVFFLKKETLNKKSLICVISFILLWVVIYPYSPCKNRFDLALQGAESKLEYDPTNDIIINNYAISVSNLDEKTKNEKLVEFIDNNITLFSIREDYMIKKYSYKYDPEFWFNMTKAPIDKRHNNRFLQENILKRLKENNVNNKLGIDLFGIGYIRMGNTVNLESDFLSQYYTTGVIGVILFIMPYVLIILITSIYILINKEKLTFKNVSLLIMLFFGVSGSYFCGNTLDNLTFTIIYSFFFGYVINQVYVKNKEKNLDKNKITIVCLHLGIGGVEKYISSLCKMLENNFKIDIISSYKVSEKPGFYFSDKVNIKYLFNDKPYKKEFINAVKKFNITDIIKYGYKNFKIILFKRYKEIKAISKIDSKYVITTLFHNELVSEYLDSNYVKISTEHNYHNNNKKYINKVVSSCKNLNYLVCVSKELKDFYEDKLNNCKVVYIPNVIDYLPNITAKKKKNQLISVGRLEYEKGFSDLIDVITLVKKEIKDIKLNIIGDGSLKEELQEKINTNNIQNNIKLLGYMNSEKVFNYIQESNIYVMTSLTESFGIVLIEAMSNKTPCIAFDSANGAKNLLKDNHGILIKNRNKKEMAKEIINLLKNDKLLSAYTENGYNYCKEYLSDNVKNKWNELLR